jgi:hypothetical protein
MSLLECIKCLRVLVNTDVSICVSDVARSLIQIISARTVKDTYDAQPNIPNSNMSRYW